MRNPQCQSNHTGDCYGILWQCERCERIICCADGQDDGHTELCDTCWTAEFTPPDPMLDLRRYYLSIATPDGGTVIAHELTWQEALAKAFDGGCANFVIRPERNAPIPDALLCPCTQPGYAVVAEAM